MTPNIPSILTNTLLDLLPQTQCTQCGYPNCQAYAQAMATGEALYNQCPPGGQEGVERLAQALDQPSLPLNTEHGVERPRAVAQIDENQCIGCTLCIQACPVDAIVGAPKQMHTVITADCTGCRLCIAPCPVDCISLPIVTGTATGWAAWSQEQADQARTHYARHIDRLSQIPNRWDTPTGHTLPSQSTIPGTAGSTASATPSSALAPASSSHKQALLQAILKRTEKQ